MPQVSKEELNELLNEEDNEIINKRKLRKEKKENKQIKVPTYND